MAEVSIHADADPAKESTTQEWPKVSVHTNGDQAEECCKADWSMPMPIGLRNVRRCSCVPVLSLWVVSFGCASRWRKETTNRHAAE
ncbi:hypothetical protein CALVIDRAFT_536109 [Calocera viscosa TUFC12733]|uniref:Uncharacterized protein n=1 Tax=Calocera viscosa (strain TUFC12733) TaxID=1330018 RepID=A0A167NAS1_CALVF|nr:hypothetical protein CALVIDRAFT_536109 [Calocera viscosa TUFC12733]